LGSEKLSKGREVDLVERVAKPCERDGQEGREIPGFFERRNNELFDLHMLKGRGMKREEFFFGRQNARRRRTNEENQRF
jgi:hypothetical protein